MPGHQSQVSAKLECTTYPLFLFIYFYQTSVSEVFRLNYTGPESDFPNKESMTMKTGMQRPQKAGRSLAPQPSVKSLNGPIKLGIRTEQH